MAQKTFLQLCNQVCLEARLAGGLSTITGIAALTAGDQARIVSGVRQAWDQIQLRHQHSGLGWRWQRKGFTLTSVASQADYAWDDSAFDDDETGVDIARFRNWLIKDMEDPMKIYLTASAVGTQTFLHYLEWDDFKYYYRTGTQNDAYPVHVSIKPDNQLALGPAPSDIYTITGDYTRGKQTLLVDGDVPELPEDMEDVLVWLALRKHALQKNISELIILADTNLEDYTGFLEMDQLSEIGIGNPLA